MKNRIILSVVIAVFSVAICNAGTNLVSNPDFETGTFANWFHSAAASIITDNGPSAPGTYAANVPAGNDARILPDMIAVTPGEHLQVSWDYKVTGADGSFWGTFRFWGDDNATVFLGQDAFTHDTAAWTTRSFTSSEVPAGAVYVDVSFFTNNATTGSITIDNISVSRNYTSELNIQPAQGVNDVPLHAVLSFDANSNDTSYDIYLGVDLASVQNADVDSNEFVDSIPADSARMQYAVTLNPYTQYYWRIDVNQTGTVITGDVNTFTTGFDVLENADDATYTRYHVTDSQGRTMDGMKVIENPAGGYLAVYHSYIYKSSLGKNEFDARLASSTDLANWTYRTTLSENSSMPTIAYHPETGGFFVIHEQWMSSGSSGVSRLRFHYYPSFVALATANDSEDYIAPITLSPWNLEGTPNIYSISPDGDSIEAGFHYNNSGSDRIGRGLLSNFLSGSPSWSTWSETALNNLLISKGVGKHIGDRDYGSILGANYMVQEAMMVDGDWSTWRTFFYDYQRQDYLRLYLKTDGGSASFGNSTFTKLISPSGKDAIVTAYFIFGEGSAPGEAGPVMFYNELQTTAWQPIPGDDDTDVSLNPNLRWLAGGRRE